MKNIQSGSRKVVVPMPVTDSETAISGPNVSTKESLLTLNERAKALSADESSDDRVIEARAILGILESFDITDLARDERNLYDEVKTISIRFIPSTGRVNSYRPSEDKPKNFAELLKELE